MGVLREIYCKTCGNTWCERCFPGISGYATIAYCHKCGPMAYLARKKEEENLNNIEIIEDKKVKVRITNQNQIFYHIEEDYFVLENSLAYKLYMYGLDPSKIEHGGPFYYEYIVEKLKDIQIIEKILTDENLKEGLLKALKQYLETKPHWSLGNEKEAQKVGLFDAIDLVKLAKMQQ